MLKGGGDPNESDSNGWSPIHMLCVKPLNASPESPPYKKEKEAWEGLMKVTLVRKVKKFSMSYSSGVYIVGCTRSWRRY